MSSLFARPSWPNMDEEAGKGLRLTRMTPLLEVRNLHVAYTSRSGKEFPTIADVSFEVASGETLGVLGESGSGKSTLAAALLRLLPANGRIRGGSVTFEGQNLTKAEFRELEKIRGARIAPIFQEPSLALHPTIRVGEQVSDVLAAHESLSRAALREKTMQLLTSVFPEEAQRIANSYPHQLSGGQRQRVLVAQAIVCGPSLVIADEPTASLDPTTQQEILSLFRTLREERKLSMMLITHNPALLRGLADRVLVLYAGRVVEIGPTESVLLAPKHPYTRALLRCLPARFEQVPADRKAKLPVIPGEAGSLALFAGGCSFEPRCEERMEICKSCEPPMVATSKTHAVSCFKWGGR